MTMSEQLSVAVLGLGLMGRPMARNLVAAGFETRGWNRSALPAADVEDIPLEADLEDAAGAAVCLFMLSDSAATGEVLARIEPRLRAGQSVLDMGSSHPLDTKVRAERLATRGIGWVDAPVSGGALGAANGQLAIMAGGTAEDVARVRPILDVLGANVVHVGGPGAGHTAKLANQVIAALAHEAVAEALALVEAAGLDPALVQQALRGGWADSRILQEQGNRMISREYVAGGKARTMRKDLAMALEMASQLGLELPHAASTFALYDGMVQRGEGDLDASAIIELRRR
jgi:3-hydroxyisobutyrate dehydrogenase-like beta-hydroxyacid dehydrogenase